MATIKSPPDTALITGEELLAMGDIGPSELIEGRLVPISPTKPRHGHYEYRLAKALGDFVDQHNLGEVQVGEVGIYVRRNPDTVRAADILFISHERLVQATPDSFLDVAPELVVEILSPDDRWTQVKKKLRQYFDIGVSVVLVVDPKKRTISLYHSLDRSTNSARPIPW
jgi:Uma2 family endonuclease